MLYPHQTLKVLCEALNNVDFPRSIGSTRRLWHAVAAKQVTGLILPKQFGNAVLGHGTMLTVCKAGQVVFPWWIF